MLNQNYLSATPYRHLPFGNQQPSYNQPQQAQPNQSLEGVAFHQNQSAGTAFGTGNNALDRLQTGVAELGGNVHEAWVNSLNSPPAFAGNQALDAQRRSWIA